MKKKEAELYSENLYLTRQVPIDIVSRVKSLHRINFCLSSRKYYCTLSTPYGLKVRHHRCYYKLCVIVWWLLHDTFSTCQGATLVMSAPENNAVTQALKDQVVFDKVTLPGDCIPKARLQPPITDANVKKALDALEEVLPKELQDKIDEFEHSGDVTDPARLQAGMVKLGTLPPKKTDRRLMFLQFVRKAIDAPKGSDNQILKVNLDLSAEKQLELSGSSSAAGHVPTHRNKLQKGFGSKRVNKWAAVSVNEHDRLAKGPLPSLPCQLILKPEPLKNTKDVRAIQIQSYSNYIIDSLTAAVPPRHSTGVALGVKTTRGGYQRLLYPWYKQYVKTYSEDTWDDFVNWLQLVDADELDKKSWEATTHEQDGLPYLMNEIARVGTYACNSDLLLHARALADYANPLISMGTWGFFATWRVASGTMRTSEGNSERHRSMNIMTCDLIELAQNGCEECPYCTKISKADLGDLLFDSHILKMRRHAWILGDDFLAPAFGGPEDNFFKIKMDLFNGTITTGGTKSFFGDDAAEFLRRRLVLTNEKSVVTQKETSRALAKITKGSARSNAFIFDQALKSARYEAGANKELQDYLSVIAANFDLPEGCTDVENTQLNGYKQATPVVADLPDQDNFNMNDVINMEKIFVNNFVNSHIDMQFYEDFRTGLEWERS